MRNRAWHACWVAVLLVAGAAVADSRREISIPDLPEYRTLKCDFHLHTVFSDGLVWPTVRVDEAWREGLDAISITDHIEYQPHKDDLPKNLGRSHELAVSRAREHNLLLIRGAEITRETPPGHFNALFLSAVPPLDTKEFYDVFDQAAKQGAFVMWNHPAWKGAERGQWREEQTRLFDEKKLHAIEICNGDQYYADGHKWAAERGLAVIGTSDVHDVMPTEPYTAEKHRTLTLVFAKERTVESIREALFARRTAAWYRDQVIGREEELAPLFAACIEVRPSHLRSKDTIVFEVVNRSDLDLKLEGIGEGKPARATLPARVTSLLRLDVKDKDLSGGLPVKVRNFLVGPKRPLQARLAITVPPAPAATTAPTN